MPRSLYNKLLDNGCIQQGNLFDKKLYSTANGKMTMGQRVHIKEIDIQGVKIYNVTASVFENTGNGIPLF